MVNHKNLYFFRDPEPSQKRIRDPKPSQKRNCLSCERLLLSEHIGNRLCPRCENKS